MSRSLLPLLGLCFLGITPLGAQCELAPSGITCESTEDGGVSLAWVNTGTYDAIRIERDGAPLVDLAGTATAYVDAPPIAKGYREYAVYGVDDAHDCETAPVHCLPYVCAVPVPTIVSCSSIKGDGVPPVEITWEISEGADYIHVYRDFRIIAELPGDADSYIDDGIDEIGRRYYSLRAGSYALDCEPRSYCESNPLGLRPDCSTTSVDVPPGIAAYSYLEWDNADPDDALEDPCSDVPHHKAEIDVDITMADLGDWSISVTSPDGTTLQLHDRGAAGAVDLRVTYAEDAASIGEVTPDYSTCGCPVYPSGPGSLYDLVDDDPRGEWTLTLEALSEGTVNSWCVGIYSWVDIPRPVPCGYAPIYFKRGDVNNNGTVDPLSDALRLLQWGFAGGLAPPCMCAADADGNGIVAALNDAIRLLMWGFLGGAAPPAPGPSICGADPQEETLCDLNLVTTHDEACGTTTGHGRFCDP